jgi:hypothetical protein
VSTLVEAWLWRKNKVLKRWTDVVEHHQVEGLIVQIVKTWDPELSAEAFGGLDEFVAAKLPPDVPSTTDIWVSGEMVITVMITRHTPALELVDGLN